MGLHADVEHERVAGGEDLARLTVGPVEPDVGHARLAAAPLAEPGRPLGGILLAGEQLLVAPDRLAGLAVVLDAALAEQHRAIAHPLERRRRVGDERDRLALLLEAEDPVDALALERLVADREHLVEEQDLRVDVDRDREAEPHVHARGVRADRQVDEALELAELDNLVEPAVDLLLPEPVDRGAEVDVVAAGEVLVEAGAELEQRADPTRRRRGSRSSAGRRRRAAAAGSSCRSRSGP